MPILFGDGKSTLEELILADDRAVCMSGFYLRKNSERIQEVPAAGKEFNWSKLGPIVEERSSSTEAIRLPQRWKKPSTELPGISTASSSGGSISVFLRDKTSWMVAI